MRSANVDGVVLGGALDDTEHEAKLVQEGEYAAPAEVGGVHDLFQVVKTAEIVRQARGGIKLLRLLLKKVI